MLVQRPGMPLRASVEGFKRPTHVVPALAAPAKAAELFAANVARRVLQEASFRARLEAAGAEAAALGLATDAALRSPELWGPEEQQALRAFCAARKSLRLVPGAAFQTRIYSKRRWQPLSSHKIHLTCRNSLTCGVFRLQDFKNMRDQNQTC
ncbi:MAG: hypothetical protein EB084_10995 [Proteobacteria bacterium]|nr:hypothetical protein [Pseudomonadota bacterium]